MRTISLYVASIPAIALIAAACGETGPSAGDLNGMMPMPTAGVGGSAGSNTQPMGGSGEMGGSGPAGAGGSPAAGGSGAVAGSAGSGVVPMGGSAGSPPVTGGTAGTSPTAGAGGGSGGAVAEGPYAPRSGSFKMLIYSQTRAFRHASIAAGTALLQQIATDQGFQTTVTENNTEITATGLAQYEIIFFMNSTGDIFGNAEQMAFEEWMRKGGAFAGVHAATDTEKDWSFYKEVTGQYYNGHGPANTAGSIQFEASMLEHPALKGIQNPWQRNEEWYRFDNFAQWSAQPGYKILGRKQADNQPIMWTREWGNFRAFYTAIGHDAAVFQNDANVKKHLTGGIMWAVRREHLIK